MPVREPDLEPLRRARSLAHVGRLGDREPERLLREHPLAGVERGADEAGRGGGRRRDHDRVDVGIGEHRRRVGRRSHAGRRARQALLRDVGHGDERRARLALDRREVCAHRDLAQADQADPEGRVAHGCDPNMRYSAALDRSSASRSRLAPAAADRHPAPGRAGPRAGPGGCRRGLPRARAAPGRAGRAGGDRARPAPREPPRHPGRGGSGARAGVGDAPPHRDRPARLRARAAGHADARRARPARRRDRGRRDVLRHALGGGAPGRLGGALAARRDRLLDLRRLRDRRRARRQRRRRGGGHVRDRARHALRQPRDRAAAGAEPRARARASTTTASGSARACTTSPRWWRRRPRSAASRWRRRSSSSSPGCCCSDRSSPGSPGGKGAAPVSRPCASCRRSCSRSSPPRRCEAQDLVPSGLLPVLADTKTILLALALFAVGARVEVRRLLAVGGRPLVLGLSSWAIVAAVAYAGVTVVWS